MVNISAIESLYFEKTWGELMSYWKKCENTESDDPPWFGPLHRWISTFTWEYIPDEQISSTPLITRIADSISDISKELGYLLPDVKDCECNIRNFLPVIIWAYCMNRKSQRNKALFEDVAYRDRVSNNGSGAEKELNIRKINTHRGLFQLKQWESVYTGLEIQNVLLDTPKRILPIYYQALLFFIYCK